MGSENFYIGPTQSPGFEPSSNTAILPYTSGAPHLEADTCICNGRKLRLSLLFAPCGWAETTNMSGEESRQSAGQFLESTDCIISFHSATAAYSSPHMEKGAVNACRAHMTYFCVVSELNVRSLG